MRRRKASSRGASCATSRSSAPAQTVRPRSMRMTSSIVCSTSLSTWLESSTARRQHRRTRAGMCGARRFRLGRDRSTAHRARGCPGRRASRWPARGAGASRWRRCRSDDRRTTAPPRGITRCRPATGPFLRVPRTCEGERVPSCVDALRQRPGPRPRSLRAQAGGHTEGQQCEPHRCRSELGRVVRA